MLVAIALAVGCALVLHTVAERGGAVRILPLAYVWGVWAVVRGPRLADHGAAVLFGVALAVRLPLVGTPLHLSDDLYRYLWEGGALAAGHDVFVEAPASLVGLDDALLAHVNHAALPSVYPPVALVWFRFLAVFGAPVAVQGLTAAVDAVTAVGIRAAGGRAGPAWVYALHPLAAIESASGGHIDVLAVALTAIGLAAWRAGRRDAAWAAIVAGALAKLFPGVLAPVLLRHVGVRRAVVWVAVGGAVALAMTAWLAPSVLVRVPAGVAAYATTWEFDGFVFPWLVPVFGDDARRIVAAVAGLAVVATWVRVRDPVRAWAAIGAVFVCTTPTMHPWYALWLLVPASIAGIDGVAAGVVPLLGAYTVLLAYDPATGGWSEAPWLWWVTWPPAFAAFAAARWLPGFVADYRRSDDSPTTP